MRQKLKSIHIVISVILILTIISIACQLPVTTSEEKSPESNLEATIVALQTQVFEQVEGEEETQKISTATDEPLPETTNLPPQINQPQQENHLYQGIYVLQNNWFSPFDFSGSSLGPGFPAGADNWYGQSEIDPFLDEVYYSEFGTESGVYKVNSSGTTKINFINSNDLINISISPNRQQIAWSTSSWDTGEVQSQIYYANLDGSNQFLIDFLSGNEQAEFPRIFYPVRWLDDGRLLYATGMTGIGGYMIFWGFNGLFLYNPLDNSIRTLVDDNERLGICLSSISDDLEKIAIVCGGDDSVRVRSLSSGVETSFPILADQVLAGAARFSPSGEWLAYVIQRADPMQELGKVVLVPVDGSLPPRILATVEDGSFVVEGWINEDEIIVSQSSLTTNQINVLKISKDSGVINQVAFGKFLDFIP